MLWGRRSALQPTFYLLQAYCLQAYRLPPAGLQVCSPMALWRYGLQPADLQSAAFDGVLSTTAYGGLQAYGGLRRPTTADNSLRRPTTAYDGLRRPTTA